MGIFKAHTKVRGSGVLQGPGVHYLPLPVVVLSVPLTHKGSGRTWCHAGLHCSPGGQAVLLWVTCLCPVSS